jgi:hypothetical protein
MKRAILAITVAIAAIPSAYPAPASAARLTVQPSQFAHVIVVLKTQVDPSTVTGSNRHQRSRSLENRLRSTADAGQRGLLTLLRRRQAQGLVTAIDPLWIFNGARRPLRRPPDRSRAHCSSARRAGGRSPGGPRPGRR